MVSSSVDVQDNRELRRVEARLEDGDVAGFAQYQLGVDEGVLTFFHTEVDERFEGHGVGSRLLAGVMDFLRDNGLRIVPRCSFIRGYMREHEETHDLLAEGASLED
jgi:predicted GNAT family acetyltransferase